MITSQACEQSPSCWHLDRDTLDTPVELTNCVRHVSYHLDQHTRVTLILSTRVIVKPGNWILNMHIIWKPENCVLYFANPVLASFRTPHYFVIASRICTMVIVVVSRCNDDCLPADSASARPATPPCTPRTRWSRGR